MGGARTRDSPTSCAGWASRRKPNAQPLQALTRVAAAREDGIYLFKDLHKFLGDPAVVRRLHDLAPVLGRGRRALVLTASDLELPPEIRSLSAMLKLELPSFEELKALVQDEARDHACRGRGHGPHWVRL